MQNIPLRNWIKGIIALTLYSLWVIWLGSFWLFIGLPIVFDIYLSKKVPWDFWKKTKKSNKLIEWLDAIIFALVAVYMINIFLFQNYKIPTSSLEKTLLVGDHLFVSKVSYGPRLPNTPLAFPLVQNTLPIGNAKSYLDWPLWDYKRLTGFGNVKRGDIVVFNFPTGDTVAFSQPNPDYYNWIRREGISYLNNHPEALKDVDINNEWTVKQMINKYGRLSLESNPDFFGEIIYRPVDKRDNYVKRCVAIAGDTFEIRHNEIYINDKAEEYPENVQHIFNVETDGTALNDRFFEQLEMSNEDKSNRRASITSYYLPLTFKKAEKIKSFPFIKKVELNEEPADSIYQRVFPYSKYCPWSRDNFGPVWIPKAGTTIDLNLQNLALYERIITSYEGNTLEVKDQEIFINGEKTNSYTFQMNYYFMMGDNRHQSADSRYWGFVPEDHIVGKPILVWLSLDKDKSLFGGKIRWDRFFKFVHND